MSVVDPSMRAPTRMLALAMLSILCVSCRHRDHPIDLVTGDAFLDWSDLAKYRESASASDSHGESGESTKHGADGAVASAILAILTRYAGATSMLDLPRWIELTCIVKDSSGHVLAAHPLQRGHNRWRDAIAAQPIDVYLKVKAPMLVHELFVKRVDDAHARPVNINVVYELVHRAL